MVENRANSEIKYILSNETIKEKNTKISKILDTSKESKKKITNKKNNYVTESNNLYKKDNTKINGENIKNYIYK